ncbi:kinase-like domain-containing protein, partial [Hyaloscypha sp. PMI_1271]
VLACKSIPFNSYDTREIFEKQVGGEVRLLKRLVHPNIVRYIDMVPDNEGVKIYTEFCEGEDLESFVKKEWPDSQRPPDRTIWSVIYQLSAALAYCHHGTIKGPGRQQFSEKVDNQGNPFTKVWHRDIKPRNILVRHNLSGQLVVKLCDFGLAVSRFADDEVQTTVCGTHPYVAPEIRGHEPEWTNKGDIFSLGCTLF